jgi:hypothetical protein
MAQQQQLASFADRGYVVVPGVLSVDQVLEARHLLETHRAAHT